eukprot:TRINITY_DN17120_c1_g1_i2.p1 TRINITY_DN17120_c1_g1~~TRINITY_DN17120_c1_g1_i2.p1  ORF type:complete len:293 (+),score=133.61 TRINITY_DN17120_c1_g1_i2:51-881(+)
MPRQVVWLTGRPGAGKTFTGDYLCVKQGFVHVDGDANMRTADQGDKEKTAGTVQAFGSWFKGETCDDALWRPYFTLVCERVAAAAAANPGKDLVVTFSNYRGETREYCRETVKALLAAQGEADASFRFIHLDVSDQQYAERGMNRLMKYLEIQGWTLQHYWDNVKKAEQPFTSYEACVQEMIDNKNTPVSGFIPLDTAAHPEDAVVDTSDSHRGVMEALHGLLSLGQVGDVYSEDFIKEIADIQYDRLNRDKEVLKAKHEAIEKVLGGKSDEGTSS